MVEITSRVRVVEVSRVEGLRTEVYILDCEGGLILVDVGFTPQCIHNIESELTKMGKVWRDIKMILITHAHGDHIDNLPKILQLTGGSEVMVGEGDAGSLEEQTGVKADLGLEQGDQIDACGGIEAVHIPGHSKGNLAYYLRKEKVMIVGDTVFGDDEGNLYPPPEKYCDDVELATENIRKLLDYDFNILLLSHGKDVLKNAKKEVEDLVKENSSP